MKKPTKEVIVTFQRPDDMLYPIGDKLLTAKELKKFIRIMPNHRFIIVSWTDPTNHTKNQTND